MNRPRESPAERGAGVVYRTLSSSSVGLEMGVAVAIGFAIGWFLDRQLGWFPVMSILWMLMGVAAGFRAVLREGRRMDRADRAQSAADAADASEAAAKADAPPITREVGR
jgi:ATP synthase protein I